jgi:hypothetical protein
MHIFAHICSSFKKGFELHGKFESCIEIERELVVDALRGRCEPMSRQDPESHKEELSFVRGHEHADGDIKLLVRDLHATDTLDTSVTLQGMNSYVKGDLWRMIGPP